MTSRLLKRECPTCWKEEMELTDMWVCAFYTCGDCWHTEDFN